MQCRQLWLYTCVTGLVVACGTRSEPGDQTGPESEAIASAGASEGPGSEGQEDTRPIRDAMESTSSDAASTPAPVAAVAPVDAGQPSSARPDGRDAQTPSDAALDAGRLDAALETARPHAALDAAVRAPIRSEGCLSGITRYKEKGPFAFKAEAEGTVKMWVPVLPAGCKVPVLHFANGTGASCANYGPILEHLASHGFLTTCYETTNSGSKECITALETAYQKYPALADDKIGSAGHAFGGAAAYRCLQRAEEKWGPSKLYAGYAAEPESGAGGSEPEPWQTVYAKVRSPMFQFNGSEDMLVSASWVGMAFEALSDSTEAYWYEGVGATHLPVPTRWAQESAVVFFRWKLLGDAKACGYFKAMPMGSDWKLQKKQAEQGC